VTSTTDPNDDGEEFAALLRAHATSILTAAEQVKLRALAAPDPERRRAVADFERLHADFAHERALRRSIVSPGHPAEEVDEGFARLAAAGAEAEAELRSRLLHANLVQPSRRHVVRRVVLVGIGLAAAWWIASLLFGWHSPPPLDPGLPRDQRAGGVVANIMIAPHLSAADRALSWSPIWHAQSYEVTVLESDGKVVLQRPHDQARSTRWEFTGEQIEELRMLGELRLRIRALDGSGLLVGATGDLPLQVR